MDTDVVHRTSDLLRSLVSDPVGERITFAEILDRLGACAFGILLILFAAPNCIPMPPGFSTICGAVIALIAGQLALGRSSIWAPRSLAQRSLAMKDLTRIIDWTAPKLARIERLSRPRFEALTQPPARQAIGILILVLAFIMALPIPIVGNTPPAIAVILMGFGLIERDGAVTAAGIGIGVLDIAVIIGLSFGFSEVLGAYMPAGWWPF